MATSWRYKDHFVCYSVVWIYYMNQIIQKCFYIYHFMIVQDVGVSWALHQKTGRLETLYLTKKSIVFNRFIYADSNISLPLCGFNNSSRTNLSDFFRSRISNIYHDPPYNFFSVQYSRSHFFVLLLWRWKKNETFMSCINNHKCTCVGMNDKFKTNTAEHQNV